MMTTSNRVDADATARTLGFTGFRDLMKQNERLVCSEVRKYAKTSKADFEDMLQEVWAKVSQRLPQFNGGSKVSTWLHVVARNTCLSYLDKTRNVNLKGLLCYEHETIQASGDDDFNLEAFGNGRSYAPSPEEELSATQTIQRILTGSSSMTKSRREAGVASMLDLGGFNALTEMLGDSNLRLADTSADFIAEVLLLDLSLKGPALFQVWEALTAELGGTDQPAQVSFEALIALSAKYGFAPELSINQIAKLLDRTVENIRVHNSRGSEDVLRYAAPDYYAEVVAHRASKRSASRSPVVAEIIAEVEADADTDFDIV